MEDAVPVTRYAEPQLAGRVLASYYNHIMYRIFISHSWSYSSQYDKIEVFLNKKR